MLLKNGVKLTTTTSGTGTITVSSVAGRTPLSTVPVGAPIPYELEDGDNKEWGVGVVASSTTIARTMVTATLVSGTYTDDGTQSAITLSGGTTNVYLAASADTMRAPLTGTDAVSSGLTRYLISRHGSWQQGVNTYTNVADRCNYIPYHLDSAGVITALVCQVKTAAAGAGLMGIYNVLPNGYIGDKIAQCSATFDAGTTGIKESAITCPRLSAGWYVLAMAANSAAAFNGYAAGALEPKMNTPFGMDTSYRAICMRYEALSGGWSNLPTTPSASTTGAQIEGTYAPWIGVKLQ
jgi:hypothetical protein